MGSRDEKIVKRSRSYILRRHPEAICKIDSNGLYYIDNGFGRDLSNMPLKDEFIDDYEFDLLNDGEFELNSFISQLKLYPTVPHQLSKEDAWVTCYEAITRNQVIEKNNSIFDPNKPAKKKKIEQ